MAEPLVTTNVDEITGLMGRLFADQVPFATSVALNETAKDFQKVQREHQYKIFEVRRKTWLDRAVKIKPFATKRSLEAVVKIDPAGDDRADIITKFEDQRRKRPLSGSRLAIPDEARRAKSGVVRRSQMPSAFDFQPHGGDVAIGLQRTISIQRPGGRGVILQRVGRGRSSRLRRLYVYVADVPIEPGLNFERNAQFVWSTKFDGHFASAFDHAVRTAR